MKGGGKRVNTAHNNRINREIRAKTVRITNIDGEQIGIFSLNEAIKEAEKYELDLIEINPNADPPVCRMMNYGKFLYDKSKLSKEQRKKQKIIQVKEIKLRPNTDDNDYKVKIRTLIRFLEFGNKVKITIRFRGREITHSKLGIKILNRICNELINIASIEYFPKRIEGRQMVMILTPKKKNK